MKQSANLLMLLAAAASVSVNASALRPRRDVSHLPLEYLPPVVLPPLPSRNYLPPVEQHAATLSHVLTPPREYLPPGNEYLPPVETTIAPETTTTTTTTAAPPTTTAASELPTTEAAAITTTEQPSVEETEAPTHEDIVEPAGLLQADGYHYAPPKVIPDLTPTAEAYLPPLEDNAVAVEPVPQSGEESAALLDDGYHYRAIRRLRF
ncbi:PREDICTED: proline-rich extensin-like protein EPR1 [Drosophila arizonae]|uniref:Proline-rich extensin-like protein EPR1 n=1 Tax=Drosophila arizonae TaxID=7263 RepID=A0ABM1P212_DROAR|nr:PREDICTED: proline-rich extensin-like protein EPR1 [Drosophila arizonae]